MTPLEGVAFAVIASAASIALLRFLDARVPEDPGSDQPAPASLLFRVAVRGGLGAIVLGGMALFALMAEPRGRLLTSAGVGFLVSFAFFGSLPGVLFAEGELLWRLPLQGRWASALRALLGALAGVATALGWVVLTIAHYGYVVRSVGSPGRGLGGFAAKLNALSGAPTYDLVMLVVCVGVPGALAVATSAATREAALRYVAVVVVGALAWPVAWAWGESDAWIVSLIVSSLAGAALMCMDLGVVLERRLWRLVRPEDGEQEAANPPEECQEG